MATRSLMEKIEALPAEKQAAVEQFVDGLRDREEGASGSGRLVERLRARRERLRRQHGTFESLSILRQLRENGD
ncbi:MAG TPA: hypothetical protein VJU18_01510 [Vicinamibacteria bacterium]|nr:hypothetical protein [Vicinamibacteria bacterium]